MEALSASLNKFGVVNLDYMTGLGGYVGRKSDSESGGTHIL